MTSRVCALRLAAVATALGHAAAQPATLSPAEALARGRARSPVMAAARALLVPVHVPFAAAGGVAARWRRGPTPQRPLATAVIGGILPSTLLTLIVLPTLYGMMDAWLDRRRPQAT